ncbi:PREDICTED: uncharacterized protein LOC105361877 [Ceratosolen solmsi marchali]|uniref:Uncharacterized protein LOC105361877 n=1 Tax=Ceratosolen solmsi marchali TaxID=326594 RepID=A0AAJ6YG50_9HYME|nr:PREDICTED: uncharacterized protein LOC105361877 [Ceratosolen solmsi marchali]XP_011497466.1 PREDICTED: uncharacterized protein LOC105361877 [Ceratosolen solmsi marchali]XP_011497467.1 PREDICTED: uncharacterized protein LOC105361877 [Ceratosolen solmsi marchali]
MRFSAVQEDGYGVGLGQETPPNNVDESMMAATGDTEPGGDITVEEGSMISNLPLLFANGYPTSLEKITLPELERFIAFMVQCSLGHDTAEVISKPQWWPKEIKFANPLVRPKKINETYMGNLKKLVFRCYTYHRSEYLLRFCSYLAQYPHDKLEYVNNWDYTTSLYLKTTGKLLVTFRNENMNYDRRLEGPRRMLLPLNRTKKNSISTKCLRRRSTQKQAPSPAMVEPPIDDIYLCDNCDAEFVGLCKMKEHEKLCYHVEPRPITPDAELVPEIKQDQFMEYFELTTSKPTDASQRNNAISSKDKNVQNRTTGRIRSSINLTRCPTIPFSSPAGLALGKKSKMMTELIQQERLERIERHLNAPPLSTSFKPKWFMKTYEFDRWSVTYKPNRDKSIKVDEYAHEYKFANYTGKPTLDLRSQLLYIACRPIYVIVTRLSDEELEQLKRDPSRYRSPERKVPRIRPRSPSIETFFEPNIGEDPNPIVIDLETDEPSILPPSKAVFDRSALTTMATIASMAKKTYRKNCNRAKRSKPLKPIIFVDLCSSDDEMLEDEDSSPCISTDENRDPMRRAKTTSTMEVCVDPNFLCTSLLTPSKLCTKPCIYPADSTSGWLTNLNIDGDQSRSFLKHVSIFKVAP